MVRLGETAVEDRVAGSGDGPRWRDIRGRNVVVAETIGNIAFMVMNIDWRLVLATLPLLFVALQPWMWQVSLPAIFLAALAAGGALFHWFGERARLGISKGLKEPAARRGKLIWVSCTIIFAMASIAWSVLGPFLLTPRGSFALSRDGLGAFTNQRVVLDHRPQAKPERRVAIWLANPIQRGLHRLLFDQRFVEFTQPATGRTEFVRLPLRYMRRRYDGGVGRVSLFHPAPLVGRRYQVDASLSVTTYASVVPLVSGFYGQAAGDAAWDDVGLSRPLGSVNSETVRYLARLTWAMNDIGGGRAAVVLPDLTEADLLAYNADLSAPLFEQARVATIRAFLAQRFCSGNLGLLQSAQYATFGMDLCRRIRAERATAGSAPLNTWIIERLRDAVAPFIRHPQYRAYLDELSLNLNPGFGRIEVPTPPDASRNEVLGLFDGQYVDPQSSTAPSAPFADILQQVAGKTPREVAAMIARERAGVNPAAGTTSDERDNHAFRIAVLEQALVKRLTLIFGAELAGVVRSRAEARTLNEPGYAASRFARVVSNLRSELDSASEELDKDVYSDILDVMESMLRVLDEAAALHSSRVGPKARLALSEAGQFIDPGLFGKREPSSSLMHGGGSGWAHPSFQRAFSQFLVATFLRQGPTGKGEHRAENWELSARSLPFLGTQRDWDVPTDGFGGATDTDEPFLPGLVWLALIDEGSEDLWMELPRQLQRIDFSLTDLENHLRPGLPEKLDTP